MKKTKKLALSAIMVALGAIFMAIGAVLSIADLTMSAISALIVAFVYIEIGSPYTWLVWLSTSLLSFIFFPGSFGWITYFLVFGIFPILKAYIERLPRKLWFIVKLVYFNVVFLILMGLSRLIFGQDLFLVSELWMKIGLYIICNIAFIAFDMFMTVMIRIYFVRFRHRFSRFLK